MDLKGPFPPLSDEDKLMTYGLSDVMKDYDEKTYICPFCGKPLERIKLKHQTWPELQYCNAMCRGLEEARHELELWRP